MKLRHMSADVQKVNSMELMLESGEVVKLEDALVLTSYASRVAVYCKMRVYLLPRYDYSVTTWKHVHAFVQDFCDMVRDYDARTMRNIASTGANGGDYMYARGIVCGSYVDAY